MSSGLDPRSVYRPPQSLRLPNGDPYYVTGSEWVLQQDQATPAGSFGLSGHGGNEAASSSGITNKKACSPSSPSSSESNFSSGDEDQEKEFRMSTAALAAQVKEKLQMAGIDGAGVGDGAGGMMARGGEQAIAAIEQQMQLQQQRAADLAANWMAAGANVKDFLFT